MIDTALSFLCLCLARGRRSWLQLHFPNRCQRMKIASPPHTRELPPVFWSTVHSVTLQLPTWYMEKYLHEDSCTRIFAPAASLRNKRLVLFGKNQTFAVLDRRAACCSASLPSPGSRGSCEGANKGGHGHHGESLELFAHHQMLAL